MNKHIVCIASEHKGNEFLEEAKNAGWMVTLVTREKLVASPSAFGIRKCETGDQVWQVLTDLDNRHTWRDHPSQFLIERFIHGHVFHVDSIVVDGKVAACGVSQYGTTPFDVSHSGGVFTSSTVAYGSDERKQLEVLNRALLMAFKYE